ncbi:MAG: lactate dehydrogenase-like 2-hydroxyacid dehydrogenase [Phenylobacterium sp.]|jgi:lactate dehydrogenase-like 2-hydroxyacid dehydrogenase
MKNGNKKILIIDLIGMRFDRFDKGDNSDNNSGVPRHHEVQAHIEAKGGIFHLCDQAACPLKDELADQHKLHFFYQPNLSDEQALLEVAGDGQYDAVIAAATIVPVGTRFDYGGVRIGAGTGNMASTSWGGGNGDGGIAPLMNTPSFNSRTTAQMAMKALLKVMPDLAVETMHQRVVAGDFDTARNLVEYPSETIESKTIAVLGYGNIGREVAKLAKAFGMTVVIFARARHKAWILSEGFNYASTVVAAATDADVISPHLGLGVLDGQTGVYANAGLIDDAVFEVMNPGAVLINYDRGELVDCAALDRALRGGQVRYAAIDADVFKDPLTGGVSGPMKPYLELYPDHIGKLELLPHAAADTEHYSRVAGAKQAVDQIFDVIERRHVVNLKGQLPAGFTDGKALMVKGVGGVTSKDLTSLSDETLQQLAAKTEQLAAFWAALSSAQVIDGQGREGLIASDGADATKTANQLMTLLTEQGLLGPFYGQ